MNVILLHKKHHTNTDFSFFFLVDMILYGFNFDSYNFQVGHAHEL